MSRAGDCGDTVSVSGRGESVMSRDTQHPVDLPALIAAATQFNVSRVEELVAGGCDVNVKDASGRTAVHAMIVSFIELDMLQQINNKTAALHILGLLVSNGLDINGCWQLQQTALHLISQYNDQPDIIKALLAAGAKVNLLDKQGHSPLHVAVIKSNKFTVKSLVEGGADVNTRDNNGKTVLHLLAKLRHSVPVIELLLNCGADVNVADNGGRTALHVTSKCGHTHAARELLKSGANVNATDNSGLTPLHYAVTGDISGEMTLLLLQHQARINLQDHISRETALHKALRLHCVDSVTQLCKYRPSVNIQDVKGDSALHTAAQHTTDICVWHRLLSRGGELHTLTNRDGWSVVQAVHRAKNHMALNLIRMMEVEQEEV